MNWPRVQLGEVVDLLSGHPFKSERFSSDERDIPLVKGENVSQGSILWDISKRWNARDWDSLEKYQLQPGDVIVAMDRPWVPAGLKWAYIREGDPKALLVQRCSRLRPKGDDLDATFLRYVIGGGGFESYVKPITTGVNVPHISGRQILDYTFHLPPLPTQRRIAGILSAYDELIANNQRRIAILEEMARALYREWFVYYRAPGVVMGEDGVPEGWEVKRLGEIADIEKGLSYKGEFLEDEGGTPMVNLKCINPGGGFRRDGTKGYSGPYKDRQSVKPGDIVFANTDLTQAGGIIGSAALVPRAGFEQGGLATHHICIARPRSYMVCNTLLYFILGDERFKDFAKGRASGTTVLGFRTGDAEDYSAIIPPRDLAKAFDEKVSPMLDLVETLHEKTANLRRTRDLLLPRLMSGRVEFELSEQ